MTVLDTKEVRCEAFSVHGYQPLIWSYARHSPFSPYLERLGGKAHPAVHLMLAKVFNFPVQAVDCVKRLRHVHHGGNVGKHALRDFLFQMILFPAAVHFINDVAIQIYPSKAACISVSMLLMRRSNRICAMNAPGKTGGGIYFWKNKKTGAV